MTGLGLRCFGLGRKAFCCGDVLGDCGCGFVGSGFDARLLCRLFRGGFGSGGLGGGLLGCFLGGGHCGSGFGSGLFGSFLGGFGGGDGLRVRLDRQRVSFRSIHA